MQNSHFLEKTSREILEKCSMYGNMSKRLKKIPLLIANVSVIENFNPDWAIVRKNNGESKLELIRETKGGVKLDELRFPQEKRKILCAIKYFEKLGVNYRVVTSDSYDWMELEEPEQLSMDTVEQEQ